MLFLCEQTVKTRGVVDEGEAHCEQTIIDMLVTQEGRALSAAPSKVAPLAPALGCGYGSTKIVPSRFVGGIIRWKKRTSVVAAVARRPSCAPPRADGQQLRPAR